ncbi:MAG: hypothetical protein ABSG57_05050 [Candidatus Bathyarchaeia archaeon]
MKAKSEPSSKNPSLKVDSYDMTLEGLLQYFALTLDKLQEKDFDAIACQHEKLLPPVLGKWQFFTVHGLKNRIIENVKNYFRNYYYPLTLIEKEKNITSQGDLEFVPVPREKTEEQKAMNISSLIEDFGISLFNAQIDTAEERALIKWGTKKALARAEEIRKETFVRIVLFHPDSREDFLPVFKLDKELTALADTTLEQMTERCEHDREVMKHWSRYWKRIKRSRKPITSGMTEETIISTPPGSSESEKLETEEKKER